eukprot:GFUD01059735.1.p1 GENE.GFUD01059735.1~~GFUD01059735.1.p1  ORF type:complete len:169 (+),score=43.16 GFUD01059735.1:347-853(+)
MDLARKGIPHHFRGLAWQVVCGAHHSADKSKYSAYFRCWAGLTVQCDEGLHREVGYYQGSAFIVGLLLREMPEEDSFAVLVKIMQDYRMREMFKPSMAELGLCMYQLDTLVQEHIPDLHVHFQSQAIHTNLYASSWFLTLFTTSLPLILSCRVMDCFLSEGMEGILVL